MKNRIKNNLLNIIILFLSVLVVFLSLSTNIISRTFLGVYLLIINLIVVNKSKYDNGLFFTMISILYFNFSFIITKYIGTPSTLLNAIYLGIKEEKTMIIAIDLLILMFSVINYFFPKIVKSNDFSNEVVEYNSNNNIIIIGFLMLLGIYLYHVLNNITRTTTLLEYSIILFIIELYMTKKRKKWKIATEILMIVFAVSALYYGDRIAVLQIILADVLINYIDKFKKKTILLITILGLFMFTLFGIYGDYLDKGIRLQYISVGETITALSDRRFAIDTSVAAYHAGLSIVESSQYYTINYRLGNAAKYLFVYTPLGSKYSKYTSLNREVRKYRGNIGGGYITSYFYFWFSWMGPIIIGLYFSFLLNRLKNKNQYEYLLKIFILSTMPRWYMYSPDLLFRGVIIFSIVYFLFFKIKKKKVA